MEKPLVVPRIVWFSLSTMMMLIVVTLAAYYYETRVSPLENGTTPLFGLFGDAFKVGLGAFIGVMSQWAALVFGKNISSTDS